MTNTGCFCSNQQNWTQQVKRVILCIVDMFGWWGGTPSIVLRYGGSAESADTYVCQYMVDRRDCVSEARYMDKIKQLPAQRVCERGFMLSKLIILCD